MVSFGFGFGPSRGHGPLGSRRETPRFLRRRRLRERARRLPQHRRDRGQTRDARLEPAQAYRREELVVNGRARGFGVFRFRFRLRLRFRLSRRRRTRRVAGTLILEIPLGERRRERVVELFRFRKLASTETRGVVFLPGDEIFAAVTLAFPKQQAGERRPRRARGAVVAVGRTKAKATLAVRKVRKVRKGVRSRLIVAPVVRVRRSRPPRQREREPPRVRGVHERARLAVALRRARGRERGAKKRRTRPRRDGVVRREQTRRERGERRAPQDTHARAHARAQGS